MLSLINFQDHPTNINKKVFFFKKADHARYFELMLIENNIIFEKQIDEEGDQTIYFGVKKSDFKTAQKLNYISIGHFRKPFIPDKLFRYFLIGFSIFVVGLAILGAILSNI